MDATASHEMYAHSKINASLINLPIMLIFKMIKMIKTNSTFRCLKQRSRNAPFTTKKHLPIANTLISQNFLVYITFKRSKYNSSNEIKIMMAIKGDDDINCCKLCLTE